MIFRLSDFWAGQGCVVALPYDLEVGAGTMCPETFFRVLGPQPWRVAYVQPSRRPADGRYGENPNRLLKHTQMQVVLKPPPANIQDMYLDSLRALGIDLRHHDIRFEEDNWEAPTLGAWGIGWQVMLDGLEITQFTYFQQSGGVDLEPISVELTYGLERLAAFLQNLGDVYQVRWNEAVTYGDMRRAEELQFSVYDFEMADSESCRKIFDLHEAEATRLLALSPLGQPRYGPIGPRLPVRKIYEFCLKCSHLFNILDARGAISVTERVALIARIRNIACKVALLYRTQQDEESLAGHRG
jgi:glycyl-tRNA synthetase alpha chain